MAARFGVLSRNDGVLRAASPRRRKGGLLLGPPRHLPPPHLLEDALLLPGPHDLLEAAASNEPGPELVPTPDEDAALPGAASSSGVGLLLGQHLLEDAAGSGTERVSTPDEDAALPGRARGWF